MLRVNHLSGFGGRRSVGGGSFTDPNSLPDIWAWFEADSYAQADNSNITTNWNDLGPNNKDLILQGVNRPTYQTNEVNGMPCLRNDLWGFDNADYPWFSVPSLAGLTAISYFLVIKLNAITSYNGSWENFSSGGSGNSHYPQGNASSIYSAFGSTAVKGPIVSGVTMTNWHVVSGWSATNDWVMKQNGSSIHSTGTNTVHASTAAAFMKNQVGSMYRDADVAAFYLVGDKVDTQEESDMFDYINAKYAIF